MTGNKDEETKMWFYRRMPGIPWSEHENNEKVLKKINIIKFTYIESERMN